LSFDAIVAKVPYRSSDAAAGALMIKGVRASSIKIESTSSMIAKYLSRWRRFVTSYSMLSRK
jgi:hypothetical protein